MGGVRTPDQPGWRRQWEEYTPRIHQVGGSSGRSTPLDQPGWRRQWEEYPPGSTRLEETVGGVPPLDQPGWIRQWREYTPQINQVGGRSGRSTRPGSTRLEEAMGGVPPGSTRLEEAVGGVHAPDQPGWKKQWEEYTPRIHQVGGGSGRSTPLRSTRFEDAVGGVHTIIKHSAHTTHAAHKRKNANS